MSSSKRIALATSGKFARLTDDDRLLIEPLRANGISAEATVWDDLSIEWTQFNTVVIRSCWDYHLRLREFLHWIATLEREGVRVCNSPGMIRWNADKSYLRDLEKRGIPIVPTVWPEEQLDLHQQMSSLGWDKAVVKPRVSATAHRTELISAEKAHLAQPLVDQLLRGPGVMVQQFMDAIQTRGEWSLIFFAGQFSHAVIKTPKAGDFRVQHDFGGLERLAEAPDLIRNAAQQVVRALDDVPLYARVDGVESEGRLLLMELELIEPALFFGLAAEASQRFARAIANRLSFAE